jgi:anti-sigma28 factor (negative regulator of flagellin synthesis)
MPIDNGKGGEKCMIITGAEYGVNFYRTSRPMGKSDPAVPGVSGAGKGKSVFGSVNGKTDRVEFSNRPDGSGSFLSEIKKELVESVDRSTDPARLNTLKSHIESGRYTVDSAEMARILSE